MSNAFNTLAQSYNDYGKAMRKANTMAGKDEAGFETLKGQINDLASDIPLAKTALADGLYQVISNGVPEDNWISYLKASAKSSVGGIADLGQVVNVTSTIIKNYGREWSEAQDRSPGLLHRGGSRVMEGSMVFWQIDSQMRVRSGKIMAFDADGRCRASPPRRGPHASPTPASRHPGAVKKRRAAASGLPLLHAVVVALDPVPQYLLTPGRSSVVQMCSRSEGAMRLHCDRNKRTQLHHDWPRRW